MSSEWQRVTLGELVEIRHGWPFKSEFFQPNEDHTLPVVVAIGNFEYTGGFRFNSTAIKRYSGEYPEEYRLSPGEVLLVMTCQTAGGEILGIPARVPDDGVTYLHNQRLGRVCSRDSSAVHDAFLYWIFLSQNFNQHLVTSASGTKILHTSPSRIESFVFLLPPLHKQVAIADVLDTINYRITLLRETNATLEAIAQALFKSWFVDFDPVHAKQQGLEPEGMDEATAALFPDSFEESELGLVPNGWHIGPILDVASLLSGGTPKTDRSEYWGGNIAWASAKDVSQSKGSVLVTTERTITPQGLEESATRMIPALATVVVARGATTGKMVFFGKAMAMNQTCYALTSKIDAPVALYCLLRREMNALVNAAHGSVFDTITTSTFAQSKVIQPFRPLLEHFEEIVSPLFQQIVEGTRISDTLATLRDTILPRLISGQLRLPEADQSIQELVKESSCLYG